MNEPDQKEFDLRLVQTIVTRSVFNAFPTDGHNRPLTKGEADQLLVKILTTLYWVNYLPFVVGLLGIGPEEYAKMRRVDDITKKVLEIDMSFAYLNILVAHYFSPMLLV